MKNKIIFLLSLIILTAGAIWATGKNDAYVIQTEYYNKMKTCTPYTASFLGGFKYEILGVKNNLCYIRQNDMGVVQTCRLPKNVAVKFSNENIRVLNVSKKNGAAYSQYVNQVLNNPTYCKVE